MFICGIMLRNLLKSIESDTAELVSFIRWIRIQLADNWLLPFNSRVKRKNSMFFFSFQPTQFSLKIIYPVKKRLEQD